MNRARGQAVAIRRIYNPNYIDDYDYTHGGKITRLSFVINDKMAVGASTTYYVYIITPDINAGAQTVRANEFLVIDDRYNQNDPNIRIINSYRAGPEQITAIVSLLLAYEESHPSPWNRTATSLISEWIWHNNAYAANFQRHRTKDVDLNNRDENNYPKIFK